MTQVFKVAITGGLALWAASIVFGTRYANNYSSTPGPSAPAVEHWPDHAVLRLASKVPTILVAIHPKCPCSSATMEELRKAVALSGEAPVLYALIYKPRAEPADWADTSVVRAARQIPGSQVFTDVDGTEIDRFHARVSGEVLLYDVSGRLRFKGGVTASRGHLGESKGGDVLAALLRHEDIPFTEAPVFGCSLRHATGETGAGNDR